MCVNFGEQGVIIILGVLQVIFPKIKAHGFPFVRFMHRVLLPEVAVQLAQHNMGISRKEAIDIIKTSTQYGMIMHTQMDSIDEQQYFSDLKRRWSEGMTSRVKIEEEEDNVVKTEPVEFTIALSLDQPIGGFE